MAEDRRAQPETAEEKTGPAPGEPSRAITVKGCVLGCIIIVVVGLLLSLAAVLVLLWGEPPAWPPPN